ncbi:MAG: NAD-dependent ubiquitin ligase [Legionellales bacterium]|nr:NAD-dependent ubiquitin ligase [Legionellales bacterium]
MSLRDVIEYVNSYLRKTFDLAYYDMYPLDWEITDNTSGIVINRPNHGLPHTARTAYIVPTVVAYFANFSNLQCNFTMKDIIKMQIVLLFAVVGRKNDMGYADNQEVYKTFRLASANAFESFINNTPKYKNLFKDDAEIKQYKNIVIDFANPSYSDALRVILRQCHCLDLPRCYEEPEFNQKVRNPLNGYLGKNKADELIDYSNKLLVATGDRILMKNKHYKFPLFEQCSHNIDICLEKISQVPAPIPDKKMTPSQGFGV